LTIKEVKTHTNHRDSFPFASVNIIQDEIVADFCMKLLTCYLQICTYIADSGIWRNLESLDNHMEKTHIFSSPPLHLSSRLYAIQRPRGRQ